MFKIFVLFAILAVAVDFESWSQQYNRVYSSAEEKNHRRKIFLDNLQTITEHNAGKSSYTLGLNQFSDLSEVEFAQQYLMATRTVARDVVAPEEVQTVGAVTPIDWRDRGAVTSVKDQGSCGSCYSFAAVATYESVLFIESKKLIDLSSSQCVDCSKSYSNNGCNGGLPQYCYRYFKDYGIASLLDYPYKPVAQTCKYNKEMAVARNTGYSETTRNSETALINAIAKSPLAVCLYAASDFQHYQSGVFTDSRKQCPTGRINHAVVAVGLGHDSKSNLDYYIIKNSWGPSWGEKGYIRMAANYNNLCAIALEPSIPTGVKYGK